MRTQLSPQRQPRQHVRCRASVLLQAMVSMMVLGGMTSMSVDVGLFYTAKTELQRAADSAALAGAAAIDAGGTNADAVQQAVAYAQDNAVSGQIIDASSVQLTFYGKVGGAWVENVTPTQAVKVTLHRTRAAGNPVKLYFAQFVGLTTIDAHAAATAKIRLPAPLYNIAGVDSASFASIGVLAAINGRFVSNGDVAVGMPLGVLTGVLGDARSFSQTTRKGSLAAITGSTAKLTEALDYPTVPLPHTNDNANLGSNLDSNGDYNAVGIITIPAGVYVVRDLNLLATLSVRLDGPVTFYVKRNFNMGAAVTLLGSSTFSASNFKVRILAGGSVTFVAALLSPISMDLYAPDTDINIAVGVSAFKGRLIGKSLTILAPVVSSFTEDRTLPDPLIDLPTLSLMK